MEKVITKSRPHGRSRCRYGIGLGSKTSPSDYSQQRNRFTPFKSRRGGPHQVVVDVAPGDR